LALSEGLQAIQEVDRLTQGQRLEATAIQQRLSYSQERLAYSVGHEAIASQALYAIARLEIAIAEETGTRESLAAPKAMAFHQVAIAVEPTNSLAANELAVLFARYGQFEDAERVLMHGLSSSAMPEMWYNLSVVYQRIGRRDLAQQARARSESLAAARRNANKTPDAPPPGSIASLIHWTEPAEFSRSGGNDWSDGPSPKPGESATVQPTTSAKPTPKKESLTLLPDWFAKGVKNLGTK
jgi:tetratricopeptide (TPR) repeat protein